MSVATSSSSSNAITASNVPTLMKMDSVVDREDPTVDVVTLETPNLASMFTANSGLTADYPLSAELVQKCLAVNPFELNFREANRRINQSSQNLFEQNGLVPAPVSLSTTGGITLLKLPSSLSHSPGIFSNINVLSADIDGENMKSADFSRLVQQMKDNGTLSSQNSRGGDDTGQGPRTADVLNAVLDMHSDTLGTINYLNVGGSASSLAQGASLLSASSIAASLASSVPTPSTSSGLTAGGLSPIIQCAPSSSTAPLMSCSSSVKSGTIGTSTIVPPTVISTAPSSQDSKKRLSVRGNTSNPPTASSQIVLPMGQLVTSSVADEAAEVSPLRAAPTLQIPSDQWETRDVKPIIRKKEQSVLHTNQQYYDHEEVVYPQDGTMQRVDDTEPSSNDSGLSSPQTRGGRGRGRASQTAELPPDERRVTILERNKAAAVRYRKRKKEEHDEMITRVHLLEQEKVALSTQNQVLRRELERVTALLKSREAHCICRLSGVGETLRAESPVDVDVLSSPSHTQHHDLANYMPQQIVSAIHPNKLSK